MISELERVSMAIEKDKQVKVRRFLNYIGIGLIIVGVMLLLAAGMSVESDIPAYKLILTGVIGLVLTLIGNHFRSLYDAVKED